MPKTRNLKRLALSFLVPFFLVGLPVGFKFYDHQYKDITEYHPGQFLDYTDSQTMSSAIESGVLFGLLSGIPSGLIGTTLYVGYTLSNLLLQRLRLLAASRAWSK